MGTRGADKRCERDGLYAVYCERLCCRVFFYVAGFFFMLQGFFYVAGFFV